MKYTVTEVNDGIARVEYEDGSYALIGLVAGMTQDQFESEVNGFAPKNYVQSESELSFISVNQEVTFDESVYADIPADPNPQWLDDRIAAYGTTASQLEYITENGIEAWQAHVATIKANNPKT